MYRPFFLLLAIGAAAVLDPAAAAPPAREGAASPPRVATARPAFPASARLSLPRGADLEAVVRGLEGALPGVVVADLSAVPARLQQPLQNAPLEQALERISVDFDRCWLRRGKTLALQRRYSHPDEDPGVEMEELRRATAEMGRLTAPFAPRLRDIASIRAKDDFAETLTPEQQARMMNGGLSLAELPAPQRQAFLLIQESHLYESIAREMHRIMQVMATWGRATVADRPRGSMPRSQLIVFYPDSAEWDGRGGITVLVVEPSARAPRRPRPEGRELPAPQARLPASLRVEWTLPAQQMKLGDLPAKLREAGGPELEIPEYARERRFWLYSAGGTRGEVLTALADMWGWELSPSRSGYFLGLPRLAPAKDAVDLYRKLRRAPPPLMHMLRAVREDVARERWGREMDRVLAAAAKAAGPDWKQFQVSQLDPENQRRLANTVVWIQYSNGCGSVEERLNAAWFLYPERGRLHLSGPIGPGKHPMLSFQVPASEREVSMWGWSVGTSTLKKR